ncbi:MAG: hypothetical protein PUF08_02475 [Clostridiales bacterium]|nr:hypothetical protein [Clostridiales bacterium]
MVFGTIGVFAGQYIATDNPFPIQLNGSNVSMEGYNIDGSTYFKLRDIADTVGGFSVDFNNNTIQLSKDGYVYDQGTAVATSINWQDMVGSYEGDLLNVIYLDNVNGKPYLNLATYRGGDDVSGELTVLDDGSLFYFNGGTRSFTLKFIDSNTIELVEDTWGMQLQGTYVRFDY